MTKSSHPFEKITEQDSIYQNLEAMSIADIVTNINQEDKTVAYAVEKILPNVSILIHKITEKLKSGGRLFYIGAGTSGRLGILDASECPPTFGVDHHMVIGLIAGGDEAIRKAVEHAEDSITQGWKDLVNYNINSNDVVVGIAASGNTPYVVSTIKKCREEGIVTGSITCNINSPLAKESEFPIEVIVGPEFVTGSSRMKAGTAQKMILNMISTATMIQLGRVKGNKMVDMQLSNDKLILRGIEMLQKELKIDKQTAAKLLEKHGSVRAVLKLYTNG